MDAAPAHHSAEAEHVKPGTRPAFWRAYCWTCGWQGPAVPGTQEAAEDDAQQHVVWMAALAGIGADTLGAAALVREFHLTYGLPVGTLPALCDDGEAQLRIGLVDEELQELRTAQLQGDLVATADALADIMVVVYGYALACGIPLDAVLAEVHTANMTKVRDMHMPWPSKCVIKGAEYVPPDVAGVLARYGAQADGA